MKHTHPTLAVLAGGAGSRMGRPKGLLHIGGRPILCYLLDRFAWPGPTLLVTGPGREHPTGWERFHQEVVDPVAGQGPLRGMLTALESASTPEVLAATVDMPHVGPAQFTWLLERLAENPQTAGVMCVRLNEGQARIEPFPCAFRASAAPLLRRRIEAGHFSVHALVQSGIALALPTPCEWPPGAWLNLNRPEDLEKLEQEQNF